MRLSQTEENYIKAIYKLSQESGDAVSTNDLSAALQNRAASVTDMVGKLANKGLIEYRKYRGVTLTTKGSEIALTVIRKHRLWECFLVQKLKFTWDEIHEVAEQLEHIQSERLIQRLEEFLGYPSHDPHGEPIPGADGLVKATAQLNIADIEPGNDVKVSMVSTDDTGFLQQLNKERIGIGSRLRVVGWDRTDGSVTVKAARRNVRLTKETARHIFVQRIDR